MFITRTGSLGPTSLYRTDFDYVRRPKYQLVASYTDMMETTNYPQ